MAAPNIANVTSIIGKTAYVIPSTTGATVLLANTASSNKVFKINSIIVANADGSTPVEVSVAINTNASGSGTGYAIASTIAVPADASLIVVDKENYFYLEEDKSIVVLSNSANDVSFTVSYEELS
jgi:hypothetical protein